MRWISPHRAFAALVFIGLVSACGGGNDAQTADPPTLVPEPVAPNPPQAIVPTIYLTEYGRITACRFTPDGLFSGCKDSGATVEDAEDLAFKGSFAYVAQSSGAPVKRCSVDADGSMSACADAGLSGIGLALGIHVDGSRLYVLSDAAPLVHVCDIEGDGALSGCRDAGFTEHVDFPQSITIQDGIGYLLGLDGPMARCAVDDADGTWSACMDAAAGVPISGARGFTLEGTKAYIGNGPAALLCDVAADGSLSDCLPALVGVQDFQALQVVVDGTNFYGSAISNSASVAVTKCSVDADTGLLSACVDAGFVSPNGEMPSSMRVRR